MPTTTLVGNTFFGIDLSNLTEKFWEFRRRVSRRLVLIEFGSTSLYIAQAKYSDEEVQFTHIKRIVLPEGATERGVPVDPDKMAALIRGICKEERIYARRAAIVVPGKSTFTTVADLPPELSVHQARVFADDPSSRLQVPVPLSQTDFDITPCSQPSNSTSTLNQNEPYFFTGVPQKLIDTLITTCRLANLEIVAVDPGFLCQLRLIAGYISTLGDNEYIFSLEMTRECSHLSVVSSLGPEVLYRLPAIRDFPVPDFESQKNQAAIEHNISAEAVSINDENYISISALDLKILLNELRKIINHFLSVREDSKIQAVALSGHNSAHPGIAQLIEDDLNVKTYVVRPLGCTGVGTVSFSSLVIHQSLGRLIGLGLRFLPHEALSNISSKTTSTNGDNIKADNIKQKLSNTSTEIEALESSIRKPAGLSSETANELADSFSLAESANSYTSEALTSNQKVHASQSKILARDTNSLSDLNEMRKKYDETGLILESNKLIISDKKDDQTPHPALGDIPNPLSSISNPVESSGILLASEPIKKLPELSLDKAPIDRNIPSQQSTMKPQSLPDALPNQNSLQDYSRESQINQNIEKQIMNKTFENTESANSVERVSTPDIKLPTLILKKTSPDSRLSIESTDNCEPVDNDEHEDSSMWPSINKID